MYTGTTADQDTRFSDKEKKMLKQTKFDDCLKQKVDMTKIKFNIIKPWIQSRLAQILKTDDDVIVEFVYNQLDEQYPDPKKIQINLTGFLGNNAGEFMVELWSLLVSAQGNSGEPDRRRFDVLLEKEVARERLLAMKAYLYDGSYGPVYRAKSIKGYEYWYCNVCRSGVLGNLHDHQVGRLHNQKLNSWRQKVSTQLTNTSKNTADKDCREDKTPAAIEIMPRQPVPPGCEKNEVSQIQVKNVGPLVGLEYVLEVQDFDVTRRAHCLCTLCNEKGDPETILAHLLDYTHMSQYIQKHFPSVYSALSPYITDKYKHNWQSCMMKIAEAIERKFGRLRHMIVEADKFEKNKMFFITKIVQSKHHQERPTVTFVELVTKEELTKTYDGQEQKSPVFHRRTSLSPLRRTSLSPARRTSLSPVRRTSRSPVRRTPRSPVRRRPRSPVRRTLLSPVSRTSLSPVRRTPRSPVRRRPRSPVRRTSLSPVRRLSLSPVSGVSSNELGDDPETGKRSNMDRQGKRRPLLPPRWSPSSSRRSPFNRRLSPSSSRRKSRSPLTRRLPRRRSTSSSRSRSRRRSRSPVNRRSSRSPQRARDNRRVRRDSRSLSQERSSYVRKPRVISENTQWNQQDNEKMETFEKLAKAIENDMEKVLQQHEENPEEHPQYNEEWEKFVNSRQIELQHEGKDTSKLNLIAEWIPFWDKRMKELHNEEVVNKKVALRKRLGITARVENSPVRHRSLAASPDSNNKHDSWKTRRRSRSPYRRSNNGETASKRRKMTGRNQSPQRTIGSHTREYAGRASAERSMHYQQGGRPISPWEKPPYHHQYYDQYKSPKKMQDVTCEPVTGVSNGEDDDSGINIMAVLRLLTALEENLGSLGPKVNNLLAQGLVMEKAEANSSEKLLDNDLNCVLLETANEMLKGQLLTGVVDNIQERAYKRAIKKTTSLIHLVSTRKTETSLNTKSNLVKVPAVGTIGEDAIAREVANMLFMQGKTDVPQGQLEPLMNAVREMAQASQQSNQPLTTEDLLNRIIGGSPPSMKYHEVTQDSDEEDYTFEDVVKAVSKNIQENEDNENTAIDTVTLITNLLSNFSKQTNSSPSTSRTTISSAPSFDRPAPGFDRPKFDKPSPGFDRPAPSFDRPAPGFDRPAPSFDRPAPGFDRPAPSFDRAKFDNPSPGFDRPAPGFDRTKLDKPNPGFDRLAPNFDRPAPSFDRPAPGFDRPAPGFDRPAPGFDRPKLDNPSPGFDRPAPGFDRTKLDKPSPGFDRPAPSFDRSAPSFDRPAPSFDRPAPGFDRAKFDNPSPGFEGLAHGFDRTKFDKPNPGFDRLAPNFDRPAPGFDRSKYDKPSSGLDRPAPSFDRPVPGFDRPGAGTDLSGGIKTEHGTHQPLKCDYCGLAAVDMNQLKNHIISNHIQGQFKCDECDYRTVSVSYLSRHKLIKHSEERPFKCGECDYSAISSNYLELHKHTKHS